MLVHTTVLLIITLFFTCGGKKICSTIKKSQNSMNMIVAMITKFVIPHQTETKDFKLNPNSF